MPDPTPAELAATGFGHTFYSGGRTHIDGWGAGPFLIRVDGRQYRFEDSDMFGPLLLRRNLEPRTRQPGEKHPFWRAYHMWRRAGRPVKRKVVAVWKEPQPGTFWRDESGRNHPITDPEWEPLGYREVPRP